MIGASARWPASVWAALVAACVGCGEGVPPEPPANLQALLLDTLYVVGDSEGEVSEVFGGIWAAEVGPDGYLAVLDVEAPAVHVFDGSGAQVGRVVETGLDEGALDRPSGIAWSGAGELLVWDPGSSWISRFVVRTSGVQFRDRWRAFAFGETGFCSEGGQTYLSYWQANQVVHEVGREGPVRSFGSAPHVVGVETLGPELQEIAIEEFTPSGLLCTSHGVLEVSFMQSLIRLHDGDGVPIWSRELADFKPVVVFTPDGMGLGRAFDEADGSHLLRSIVPWGDEAALVQHELRTQEFTEEGEVVVIESRLIRLHDGAELDRTRALPLILSARGNRLYSVRSSPVPQVVVLEASGRE